MTNATRRLVVVWRVFDPCPLACPFCGYSRELTWRRGSADVVQVQRFGRLLSQAREADPSTTILVSWLGGEPLLWDELPALAEQFSAHFRLQLGVTTSGLPLQSSNIRQQLLRDYHQLTVSVDGFATFHDGLRGQAGLFEETRQAITELREQDDQQRLWRRVNTILMRDNIGDFPEFCHEMAAWGFQELTFNALGGVERPEFYRDHRLLPHQVSRFVAQLPELRQRMREKGLQLRGSPSYLERLQASADDRPIAIDDCRPATRFLFIDTSGRISPCSFTTQDYPITLDAVQTLEQFQELPARFAELRKRRATACDDCHATHVFDKFEDGALVEGSWKAATR